MLAYLHAEGAVVNSHKIGSISGQVIPASCVAAVRVLRGCGGKQVSGIRCHGVSEESPRSGVRSPKSAGLGLPFNSTPDSCLLHFKNEGDSGDIYENKGGEKQVSGIRCQVSGKKSEVRRPKLENRAVLRLGAAILTSVS